MLPYAFGIGSVLFFAVVSRVKGHAYLLEPRSRNVLAHLAGTEYCPHCLQANGPSAVKARGQGLWPTVTDPGSHGLCGDPAQNSPEPLSIGDMKYMVATNTQRTYTAGSVVSFVVAVSTHHMGHYEFRICDRALDGGIGSAAIGQECLNTWVLERAPRDDQACGQDVFGDCQPNNPAHPGRWYLPPPTSTTGIAGGDWQDEWAQPAYGNEEIHVMRFVIPGGLSCERCTLQWYYATGNTCAYDGDYLTFDPGFKFWVHYKQPWATCGNACCGDQGVGSFGEEFWNCADVKVLSADRVGSSTTTAVGTWAPTLASSSPSNGLPQTPTESPVARYGALRTVGKVIVDKNGNTVQLRGMSLFWSQWSEGSKYYNEDAIRWLVQDWNINLVRIAMGVEYGGYLENPAAEISRVRVVVNAAIELGIYVIIDWHDHNADQHITQAKSFFDQMAEAYGSFPNVLFETFNEPVGQSWGHVIKPYHQEIVSVIRKYSSNLIILGSRTWSQDVDEASMDPVEGENLAYTLHFYANTHRDNLRDKARIAISNNVVIFVTEWGMCSADGNGALDLYSTQLWLDFLSENHISDANWAISDKRESCAALQPGASALGSWTTEQLTASGIFVRNAIHALMSSPSPVPTSVPAQVTLSPMSKPTQQPTFSALLTTGAPTSMPHSTTTKPTLQPSPTSRPTYQPTRAQTMEPTQLATPAPTSGSIGCDRECTDLQDPSVCQQANIVWGMCSGSDSWWHSQCMATCSMCSSGLGPCTTPPPDGCDPSCFDTLAGEVCAQANTVWNMCSASQQDWWHDQCRAFCGLCTSALPPCRRLHAIDFVSGSSPTLTSHKCLSAFTAISMLLLG